MKHLELRRAYHRQLCREALALSEAGVPNSTDKSSKASVAIARRLWQRVIAPLECEIPVRRLSPQSVGKAFEMATRAYLEQAFRTLERLRPGEWQFHLNAHIHDFVQYRHLADLNRTLRQHPALRAALGDYLIAPDIVISRLPVADEIINQDEELIANAEAATLTPLRRANNATPMLHASISCKWTIRSDRSQNVRTEGLNLIRNRKGHTPHIVAVTAEPLPGRLASLALGTGDLDCIYHVALPELREAVAEYGEETAIELLETMISGQRLRDISDLPFDLAA